MTTVSDELRLRHLHTASRAVFSICPQLSAYFGDEFHTSLGATCASDTLRKQMCPYCGVAYVDSISLRRVRITNPKHSTKRTINVKLNSTLRLTPEERKKAWKDRRNVVCYDCAMCDSRIIYPGSTNKQLRNARASECIEKSTDKCESVQDSVLKKTSSESSENSAKKRKRSGKKHGLLAMVAAKKKKDAERSKDSKSGSGLSLDDFLSSL